MKGYAGIYLEVPDKSVLAASIVVGSPVWVFIVCLVENDVKYTFFCLAVGYSCCRK